MKSTKPMSARNVIRALKWAIKQAEENLGLHVDGPNEQNFKQELQKAKDAYHQVRKYLEEQYES